MIRKKNKKRSLVIYSLLVVTLLFAGFLTWAEISYKPFIKNHLSGWVAGATDNKYDAAIDDISIHIFTRQVTITGIKIWPDTNIINNFKETGRTHNIAVTLTIPKLQLNSVKWMKLVSNKELSCGKARIWQPRVFIASKLRIPDSSLIQPEKKGPPAIKKIFAQSIDIMQPDIAFRSFDIKNDSFDCRLKGGNATLNEWTLSDAKSDTGDFLLAKACTIDSSSFSFCKPNTLYEFKTSAFYFSTDKKQLSISDLVIATTVNRETYYRIKANRGTICNIHIPQTEVTGIDGKRLIHAGDLFALAITIKNPAIELYYDYRIPYHPENLVRLDPHQLLRRLPVKINIGTIAVNNGSAIYTEFNDKSLQEGSLSFDNINCHSGRLTNMRDLISENDSLTTTGSARLLHKSKVTASYNLSLYDSLGAYTIDAHAEDITASEIRKPASALTLLRVDSLQLSSMHAHIKGNQYYSQSELTILYTKLKIALQKAGGNATLKTKPGISAIANAFFVYTDNPMPGDKVRTAATHQPRDPATPFFPVIVKNIKTGTKSILTRHEKTVNAFTKTTVEGKEKKKGFFKRLFGKKD